MVKIKEVIAQTGLTDRAIRLYIENGLVAPKNEKSYHGRNNYDFTQENVKALEQIAILRKADFSIEQIKALQAGGQEARAALNGYLRERIETVQTGQKILSALENVPEIFSMEELCAWLHRGLEAQPLPKADAEPTQAEKNERKVMLLCSGACLLMGILHVVMWIADKRIYPFPQFQTDWGYYIGAVLILIPFVPLALVLYWYRKAQLNEKKKASRQTRAIAILAVSFVIYLSPITILLQIASPIYSETTDPKNYMVLGENATDRFRDDIYKLFPTSIPDSLVEKYPWPMEDRYADSVQYHYRYENDVDPEFHIFAQWKLPEADYQTEKQRIRNYYAQTLVQTAQWGGWTCFQFSEDPLEEAGELCSYYYLLFACNDATCEVRYVVTYCLDLGQTHLPYFMKLE